MKAYGPLFSGCGINTFRMDSSNSSLAAKSCACAYIAFLAGIFSWYADSSCVYAEQVAASEQTAFALKLEHIN
jgi:hypothetical protein